MPMILLITSLNIRAKDDLFDFPAIFEKYYSKKFLNDQDGKFLEKVYESYSKTYQSSNEREMKKPLPLIMTKAHHVSFYYWLQFVLEHPQGAKVKTLFHLDSHTDLGGVDKSLLLSKNEKVERILLSKLLEKMKDNHQKGDSLEIYAKDILMGIHDIATPIMAALQSQIISQVILCLPPWNKEVPLSNHTFPIGMTTFSKNFFPHAKYDRSYPTLVKGEVPLLETPSSPFVIISKNYQKYFQEKTVEMHLMECFSSDWKKAFEGVEPRKNFILGIDLDLFATNGDNKPLGPRPKSYFRGKKKEFKKIKERIDGIVKNLKQLKDQGYTPLMITLADSTETHNKISHFSEKSGGDFTPLSLAFLINYQLQKELNNLYRP